MKKEWISVKDYRPPFGVKFLIFIPDDNYSEFAIGIYTGAGEFICDEDSCDKGYSEVETIFSHWMLLPEGPIPRIESE
jgi:hypothetical protein